MKNYVAGLMFSSNGETVALIVKNKPDWQKDLLNGIGGKIEPQDYSLTQGIPTVQATQLFASNKAMIREFEEETEVNTDSKDWNLFLQMGNENGNSDSGERSTQQYAEGWSVDFYRSFSDKVFDVKTTTDEEVVILPVSSALCSKTIDNLKWIILLALDKNPKLTYAKY